MRQFLTVLLLLASLSCKQGPTFAGHSIYKSIDNDSALFYYELGWKQIMDEGNYGPAELSYRKVLEHDPYFLVGKAVLGRLTLDLEERLEIQNEISENQEKIKGDERLILDAYFSLVEFTNAREQMLPETKKIRQKAFRRAERNLAQIAHKYPDEIYMKAEYIEFLHARYGPRNALDSLDALTDLNQRENPFLLGYCAVLQAEMDNFDVAVQLAERLRKSIDDPSIPKPYVVMAKIHFQMDSLKLAKINVNKACVLDSRNLDASRLKEKIDRALLQKGDQTSLLRSQPSK